MGLVLTVGVLLLLGLVWVTSRQVDHRFNTAKLIENKVVDWYIATGKVSTLPARRLRGMVKTLGVRGGTECVSDLILGFLYRFQ